MPLSLSWADLVDLHVAERGSLAELARSLQDTAPQGFSLSDDPLTVERGLRRLRQRGHAPGDKYGRLLIRTGGIPRTVGSWARALGQYHSRLSDLSVPVRRDQLRLWDRPPIAESRSAAWIHLGLASVAHQREDPDQVRIRLDLAGRGVDRADAAARVEWLLFEARLARDATIPLDQAREHLDHIEDAEDRSCYLARICDQRAYRLARDRADPDRLAHALACYREIPEDGPPFVRFRRSHGLAWCAWKAGDPGAAAQAAAAVRAAGDGGLLRFRCQALRLLGHISGDPGAFARATAIATALGDDALIATGRSAGPRRKRPTSDEAS